MKLYKLILIILTLALIMGCTQPVEVDNSEVIVAVEDPDLEVTEPNVPEEEPVAPEVETPGQIPEEEAEPEVPIEPIEEETTGTTHTVKVLNSGFEPTELDVQVGDTVNWVNEREGNLKIAQVVGSRQCTSIKSTVFNTGESFSHTFDKAEQCVFVETITVYQVMTVNIK